MRRHALAMFAALAVAACSSSGSPGGSVLPGGSGGPSDSNRPDGPTPFAGSPATVAPTRGPAPTAAPGRARLEPDGGAYFGLNLDWGRQTALDASERLGRAPAVWVQFARFPLDAGGRSNLDAFIEQVEGVGGLALITLEPHEGLAAVTDAAAAGFGDLLASYWTDHGVRTFVRFAHEMNGSWYPWAQQPAEYVAAFRRVAAAVHGRSPSSAMIWAPNEGSGYPFTGGPFGVEPDSASAVLLDTNGDGTVTRADDPYAPYYPGDDAVDWIGVSLYHWGLKYPWGENERPKPGAFEALIRGTGTRAHGDTVTMPDLYAAYADGHDKPLAIVETAILYDPAGPAGGPTEVALKSAWFDQVFASGTRTEFPRIGMINWFEWRKTESEVGRVIDWRLAGDPALARSLLDSVPEGWLRFAGD